MVSILLFTKHLHVRVCLIITLALRVIIPPLLIASACVASVLISFSPVLFLLSLWQPSIDHSIHLPLSLYRLPGRRLNIAAVVLHPVHLSKVPSKIDALIQNHLHSTDLKVKKVSSTLLIKWSPLRYRNVDLRYDEDLLDTAARGPEAIEAYVQKNNGFTQKLTDGTSAVLVLAYYKPIPYDKFQQTSRCGLEGCCRCLVQRRGVGRGSVSSWTTLNDDCARQRMQGGQRAYSKLIDLSEKNTPRTSFISARKVHPSRSVRRRSSAGGMCFHSLIL